MLTGFFGLIVGWIILILIQILVMYVSLKIVFKKEVTFKRASLVWIIQIIVTIITIMVLFSVAGIALIGLGG